MNSITLRDDKRVVLPQWLPFTQTSQQPESSAFDSNILAKDYTFSIEKFLENYEQFKSEPVPYIGSELMGVAVVLGLREVAREIAQYVVKEPLLSQVARNHANLILGISTSAQVTDGYLLIHQSKLRLSNFPRDAITWIERARMYTIMGQFKKARRSVLTALHLAPTNRFVVRASIRFFVHTNLWDYAYKCGKKAVEYNPDPLIFGPYLSVATRLGKLPTKLKTVANHSLSASNTLLHSENLEALGTLEIINGARQKSKRFFRRAWENPTKAVVGHSQWVLSCHLPGLAEKNGIDFTRSKEATSWLCFNALDFSGVVAATSEWSLEEPYARAPIYLGVNATCALDRYKDAAAIARRGIIANPNDSTLWNAVAFAELRSGNIVAAEKAFSCIRGLVDDPKNVAATATFGLMLMCKGHVVEGEGYYSLAIRRALEAGENKVALNASLHYLVSILEITRRIDHETMVLLSERFPGLGDPNTLGTARAFIRRLNKIDVSNSAKDSDVIAIFCKAVKREEVRYAAGINVNLLPPKVSASASPC